MEHFIKGITDYKKFLCIFGHSQGIIKTSIKEGILSVKPQDLPVVKRISQIVFHKLFIFLSMIHLFALLDKSLFRCLHIHLIFIQISQTVYVTSVWDKLCLILYLKLHEIRQTNLLKLIRLFQYFYFLHILSSRQKNIVIAIVNTSDLITIVTLSYFPHHFNILLSYSLHHYTMRISQNLVEVVNGWFVKSNFALILSKPSLDLLYGSTNRKVILLKSKSLIWLFKFLV